MEKIFEIKLYDYKGIFKKQITKIASEISFAENINGMQGQLNLEVFGEPADFSSSDIIEIRESYIGNGYKNYYWDDLLFWNDNNFWLEKDNNVFPIYSGIIESVGFIEYENFSKIVLQILGIGTALNDIIYKNGSNKTFTKNGTPGIIAKDIIDYFNSQYGLLAETQNLGTNLLFYNVESVDITGTTLSFEFDELNCFESLEKITKDTGFYFFINPEGKMFFRKTNTPKNLTFKKEIIQISHKKKKEEMVNKLFLRRSGGIEKIYTNNSSITDFNLKEKIENRSEIEDETTQDLIGNEMITDFGDERIETEIEIKAERNNFLYPGDFISTQNTKNIISNKRIEKIEKRKDVWTLFFGDYISFGKTIISQKK